MRKLSKLFFLLAVAASLAAWTFLSNIMFVEPAAARLPSNCDKTKSIVVCSSTGGTLTAPGDNRGGVLKGSTTALTTTQKGSLNSSHTRGITSTSSRCVDHKCS